MALGGAALLIAIGVLSWDDARDEARRRSRRRSSCSPRCWCSARGASGRGCSTRSRRGWRRARAGPGRGCWRWWSRAAAAVTAVLGLDATVVLLTPAAFAAAAKARLNARPHVYACAHLANSASLLLPISNLTNLLAFRASELSFAALRGADGAAVGGRDRDRVGRAALGLPRRRSRRRGRTPRGASRRCRARRSPCSRSRSRASSSPGRSGSTPPGRRPRARWHGRGERGRPGRASTCRCSASCSARADRPGARRPRARRPRQRHPADGAGLLALLGRPPSPRCSRTAQQRARAARAPPAAAAAGPATVLAVLIGVNAGPNLTYRVARHAAVAGWLRDRGEEPGHAEFHRLGALTVPPILGPVRSRCGS